MANVVNSILHHCAKELGNYLLESEWDLILAKIESGDFSAESREGFMKTIKGYTYYNALVCSCSGDLEAVNRQLDEDFEEVMESLGIKEYKEYSVTIEVRLLSNRGVQSEIIDVLADSLGKDEQAILGWDSISITE